MRAIVMAALVGVVSVSGGCATTYDEKLDSTLKSDASDDESAQAEQLIAEGDALWAERADEAKLKAALAKWELAVKLKATPDLAAKLARGHYFLGDGYYAVRDEAEARDSEYQIGLDWANEALKLAAPEYAAAKAAGKPHEEAIRLAPKEAVPAMYWYSSNLGKWAASKGFATRLQYKEALKGTMEHVKSLDENYYYAGAWRYFGAYEAATAGLAGGSLEKSQENFVKAIEMAPAYLGTKVLFADYLCPKLQKDTDGDGQPDGKVLFKRLLEEVIAADANADPEIAAENAIEQQKAKKLLTKIDDLF